MQMPVCCNCIILLSASALPTHLHMHLTHAYKMWLCPQALPAFQHSSACNAEKLGRPGDEATPIHVHNLNVRLDIKLQITMSRMNWPVKCQSDEGLK